MPLKLGTPLNLRTLLKIIALAIAVVITSACATKSDLELSAPGCDWKLWQGNPSKGGITRLAALAPISCSDPVFSQYTCLTADDLKNMLECGGR